MGYTLSLMAFAMWDTIQKDVDDMYGLRGAVKISILSWISFILMCILIAHKVHAYCKDEKYLTVKDPK
jgi:hypothetical protein